jgi:DNA-binding transcriptional regulator YhcF (GntR family)
MFRANYTIQEELPGLHKVNLVPGQFITSTRRAAEAMRISVTTLYEYLTLLESEHLIERRANNRYTVITIQNWNELQHPERKSERKLDTKLDTENTLNTKEAAISKLSVLLGKKFKVEDNRSFRQTKSGWVLINDPKAYLASIYTGASVDKSAKDISDQVLLATLQGKKPGIDPIPSDIFYEALDRGIYHE